MIWISAANHNLCSSNTLTFVDIVEASFIRSESKLDLFAVKTVDPYHVQLNIEHGWPFLQWQSWQLSTQQIVSCSNKIVENDARIHYNYKNR